MESHGTRVILLSHYIYYCFVVIVGIEAMVIIRYHYRSSTVFIMATLCICLIVTSSSSIDDDNPSSIIRSLVSAHVGCPYSAKAAPCSTMVCPYTFNCHISCKVSTECNRSINTYCNTAAGTSDFACQEYNGDATFAAKTVEVGGVTACTDLQSKIVCKQGFNGLDPIDVSVSFQKLASTATTLIVSGAGFSTIAYENGVIFDIEHGSRPTGEVVSVNLQQGKSPPMSISVKLTGLYSKDASGNLSVMFYNYENTAKSFTATVVAVIVPPPIIQNDGVQILSTEVRMTIRGSGFDSSNPNNNIVTIVTSSVSTTVTGVVTAVSSAGDRLTIELTGVDKLNDGESLTGTVTAHGGSSYPLLVLI